MCRERKGAVVMMFVCDRWLDSSGIRNWYSMRDSMLMTKNLGWSHGCH